MFITLHLLLNSDFHRCADDVTYYSGNNTVSLAESKCNYNLQCILTPPEIIQPVVSMLKRVRIYKVHVIAFNYQRRKCI